MANVVNIKITADDLASDKIEGVDKKSKGLSERLSNMRGPLLAAGAALTGVGIASAKLASDLVEAQNAANNVFGGSISTIEAFAANTAIAYGVSKRAAFEYTSTLGGIAIASGLSQEASAELSVDIVKLAGDLASMKNLNIEVALQKMQAGLVGEIEPLRQVGVLLSAAAVEQKAFELGLASTRAELTEGVKVQARYALMVESLTEQGVVGDAIRTQDEFAGQLRLIKAQLENVTGELGLQLLPALTKVLQAISDMVGWFGDLDEDLKTVIIAVGGVTAGMVALGLVIPPLIGLMTALGVASNIALAGIPLAIAGITAGITLLILKWDEVKQFFNDHAMKIVAALGIIMPPLSLLIATVRLFSDGWKNAVNDIIDTLNNTLLAGFEGVLNQVRNLWNKIPDWLRPGPEWEEVNLKIEKMRLSWDELGGTVRAVEEGWAQVDDTLGFIGPKLPPVTESADNLSNALGRQQGMFGGVLGTMNNYVNRLGDIAVGTVNTVQEVQAVTGAFDAQQRMLNNLALEAGRARQALLDLSSVQEQISGNEFAPTVPSPPPDPISGGGSGSPGDPGDAGGSFSPDVFLPRTPFFIGRNPQTGYFAGDNSGTRIELGTIDRVITLRSLDGSFIASGLISELDAQY